MSDSLWPHGLQHTRLPCFSLSPGISSTSCPLNWWCHPTISSSVVSFSYCYISFPASGSFLMSQLFSSGSPSICASASASVLPMNIQSWFPLELTAVLPMNIQSWFPLELTALISLLSKGLNRVFSSTTVWKPQFFSAYPSLWSNCQRLYMTSEKA